MSSSSLRTPPLHDASSTRLGRGGEPDGCGSNGVARNPGAGSLGRTDLSTPTQSIVSSSPRSPTETIRDRQR
uniref:Uncharacterized protein n=1 Tax=Arundo donax TaxID=35708 RepID=A0A0A8Y306_ARUDO